ncbi:hypothetical protein K466DRAFT_96166 [Polyporus arcularius HHB13444]|uniref:Uncharacterized protein n=1 Tax=Polyporus arcularius HHB13444 TaxID=1314778 RepID=A0A5C3PF50_9APHY|nr:hypothetical protein K466DRAFT_96166 [Polyporus arcularius HHB13444]
MLIIYGCFKSLHSLASVPCRLSVKRQRITRCPLACNISTDAQQWSGRTDEEPFSPELRNKKEAELWIRRAYAVLCLHLPGDTYKAKRGEEIKALTDAESDPRVLQFTKNKVVINIYDHEGTDLSFVDLPGIEIDYTVIKLVDDLTLEYISQSSTVILVTAPADDKLRYDVDPAAKSATGTHSGYPLCVRSDLGRRFSIYASWDLNAST